LAYTRDAGNINAIARALSLSSNGVDFDTPTKMSVNADLYTLKEWRDFRIKFISVLVGALALTLILVGVSKFSVQ
jgi:hypothetical protein